MKSGWVTKKLGEVCEIKLGKTPPRDDYSFWDRQKSSGYVWVSISDMASLTDGQIIDSKEYITNKAIEGAGVPIVKKGTLLLSFKLTIGRTAIAGRDLSTNEAIAALPLKQEFAQLIDLHYLVFYFAAFDWYLFAAKDDKMLGKTLNKKRLATVPVLIPPLAEQKRIVAKIDAAFEKIDKLKANAERNLANAKELFQSALDEAMRPKKGWVEKRLGEVYDVRDGTHDSPRYVNEGWPLITSKNLRDGAIVFDGVKYISKNDYDAINVRSRVDVGDVLMAMIGTIGNPVVVIKSPSYAIKNMALFKLQEGQCSQFLRYLLMSPDVTLKMERESKGSTQHFVSLKYLRNFKAHFPPLSEQREIVKGLDLLAEKIKILEQNYTQQIADCAEMRQSVLREAFEGRL